MQLQSLIKKLLMKYARGMKEYYGNPSSLHGLGIKSEKKINEARDFIVNV